eukprot:TRINITY_DN123005_c0_g1_i1.p1 TRINITY_DN123005_c0_g1~~TRINITY_DN123005_c0_g1_i1.p1  ORF type:complete len:650 (+),score=186.38 TRINITY_DN123005_c0_g1_i1:141-2090(+)
MMALSGTIATTWQDVLVSTLSTTVYQELFVFVVFLVSFHFWRKFNRGPRGADKAKVDKIEKAHSKAAADTSDDDDKVDVPETIRPARPSSTITQRCGRLSAFNAAARPAGEQILRLLEQREFTRALNVYRSLERIDGCARLDEAVYSAFLLAAIRMGKMDIVERMLRDMRHRHVQPSLQLWQSCLKMLASRKHFSTIVAVAFIFDADDVPLDTVIYSCFVNAALEVGAHDAAEKSLKRYGKLELESRDNVLFFRTYAATGNADAAEELFKRLGHKTTTLMLNLLLITCVNSKDALRAHRILELAHGLEKANDIIVDVVSYNTVLKGYAQEANGGTGPTLLGCVEEMLAHGVIPDDVTLGTVLEAGSTDDKTHGKVVSLLIERCRKLSTGGCATFLKALLRSGKVSLALELYEEIKAKLKLDLPTYSLLIKALVDANDAVRALRIFEEMKSVGLRADDMLLTHLVEACRLLGDLALGFKLFEDLISSGATPSAFLLVAMLKLCGHCGAAQEALKLLSGWEKRTGGKPTVIHYTCVMSGCLRNRRYNEAWATYELMLEKGVTPDRAVYSTLLPGLMAAQDWDKLLDVTKRLPGAAVSSCQEVLNSALAQLAPPTDESASVDSVRWLRATKLRQAMQDAGVPITGKNAKASA